MKSPPLAAGALSSSINACLLGAVLIIAFMIVWYKAGGLVAVLSVSLNVLLVVAVLSGIFQATFTLPGMAALVLTIGMAVDANILIFERIREELKAGKSSENALTGGYSKAFSTIIDANLTTLITASILIWLGTGPVKGFGITLAIGIATSVFFVPSSSVVSFFPFCLDRGVNNLISLQQIQKSEPKDPIDFHRYRKIALLASWIIVGIGIFPLIPRKIPFSALTFGEAKNWSLDSLKRSMREILNSPLKVIPNWEKFSMFTVLKLVQVKHPAVWCFKPKKENLAMHFLFYKPSIRMQFSGRRA